MSSQVTTSSRVTTQSRRRLPEGAHERPRGGVPAPRAEETPPAPAQDSASDVVRWAAFSCVLVPVVLVGYGTSLAGAAGSALGLVAVTGVCRLLLRQSERGAARLVEERSREPRGRHGRTGAGAHRGGRHAGGSAPED
ncbi:hypothetical protein M4V62_26930 [Streptomyces durmitorensis]|uniref:Uncharacterized protein n=1 Tax=Streptomyces durmitorensis TaxID=319947 RepID=A0ABY4PZP1_9ACTN|nr:hypothetical protein [Streptomyces durmitorensis]UQT58416.1 hypothetical protein M4V62_26930 [Streptomyces durmitorensis]